MPADRPDDTLDVTKSREELIGELAALRAQLAAQKQRYLNLAQTKKQTEEALAYNRELLQHLFDSIPVLLVMWNPRLQRFTLNRHAETVLGWTTDDANKGDFMSKVYPDPAYRAEVAAYMRSLEPGWREWRVTVKNGGSVPIDWANIRLTDDTMIGIGVDLRELRNAEAALRENERRLSAILEQLPVGVAVIDPNGGFVLSNSIMQGYAPHKIVPSREPERLKRWRALDTQGNLVPPSQWPGERALRGETVSPGIEFLYTSKSGREYWSLVSAVPFRSADNGIIGAIVVTQDINQRKKAEAELQDYRDKLQDEVNSRTAEIEKQKQQLEKLNLFTKQMAQNTISVMENDRKALSKEIHDSIGGSLSAIKMLLETRLHGFGKEPPEGIMSFEEIIGHLAETIKESKRISQQMRSLALDDFGLAVAVTEIIKKFKEFYPKIEIDYRPEISQEDISQEIKTVVYRVIQEALNNIGKHSSAQNARIELAEQNDRILLKIRDNGCGFDVRKIFEMDQPLQCFGMHSMKERVELCNGTFQVESEPGKGTLLSASIPKKVL